MADAAALDRADPLAHLRELFALPEGVVYLDGNSLGALPQATRESLARVVSKEWGAGLIRSWGAADWIGLAGRTGDAIAPLIGAETGTVVACDSTSVNLFKALHCAGSLRKGRTRLIADADNFPTDVYIARSVAEQRGLELVLLPVDQIAAAIDELTVAVTLSHVSYRSSEIYDLPAITQAAHAAGALAVWDLAHSAGALRCDVGTGGADLAIGCGYKYLNGGPGAPAFLYCAPQHLASSSQPLTGWFGHDDPFAFEQHYRPAVGIERFLTGTTPVLSMSSLATSLEVFRDVSLDALRAKSVALGELFVELFDRSLAPRGFALATPRDSTRRGSHVALTHPDGHPIVRALIERGIIGDFRAPDLLRFGFASLYNRFSEVEMLVDAITEIVDDGTYRDPRLATPTRVT